MKINMPKEWKRQRTDVGNMPKFANPDESCNEVCIIKNVKQIDNYLEISFDVFEGENKDIYARKFAYEEENPIEGKANKWKGVIRKYLPDTTSENYSNEAKRFNQFLDDLEFDNADFVWDGTTDCMKGCLVGIKFQATPYEIGDKIGYWQKPKYTCGCVRIRSGKEKLLPVALASNNPIPYQPKQEKEALDRLNNLLDAIEDANTQDLPDEKMPWE